MVNLAQITFKNQRISSSDTENHEVTIKRYKWDWYTHTAPLPHPLAHLFIKKKNHLWGQLIFVWEIPNTRGEILALQKAMGVLPAPSVRPGITPAAWDGGGRGRVQKGVKETFYVKG